jgi:hypothetical protein
MLLNEDNYREVINGYAEKDWQPLLDLIPEIEDQSSFGEVIPGQLVDDNVTTLPFMAYDEIVGRFVDVCYSLPVMVVFNWGGWQQGRQILQDPAFDFDMIDVPDMCRLITSIIRTDRFSEGYLVAAFESGVIINILKSIRKQTSGN